MVELVDHFLHGELLFAAPFFPVGDVDFAVGGGARRGREKEEGGSEKESDS
jgi:hypothetical protein